MLTQKEIDEWDKDYCHCDNYYPDIEAMGDCKNCGHTYESHKQGSEK